MSVIGIDLGGTLIRTAVVNASGIITMATENTPADGSEAEVLNRLFASIESVIDRTVQAIGIGVPSVVDLDQGIVYDVQNIPAWKEVHLKSILEKKYGMPVFVNNDANCFVLGEQRFGVGREHDTVIGLTLGTGLGGGIVINGRLFSGTNCGAGEFGMVRYLDGIFENYASGQLFERHYQVDGKEIYKRAMDNEADALSKYREFGIHLGEAIKMILYTYDPQIIILGGSISKAFHLFEKSMWDTIRTFAYKNSLSGLEIKVSALDNVGVLGAAALCFKENDKGVV